jgi:hypothetical protein
MHTPACAHFQWNIKKILIITSFILLCRGLPLKKLIINSLSKTLAAAADA